MTSTFAVVPDASWGIIPSTGNLPHSSKFKMEFRFAVCQIVDGAHYNKERSAAQLSIFGVRRGLCVSAAMASLKSPPKAKAARTHRPTCWSEDWAALQNTASPGSFLVAQPSFTAPTCFAHFDRLLLSGREKGEPAFCLFNQFIVSLIRELLTSGLFLVRRINVRCVNRVSLGAQMREHVMTAACRALMPQRGDVNWRDHYALAWTRRGLS